MAMCYQSNVGRVAVTDIIKLFSFTFIIAPMLKRSFLHDPAKCRRY